MEEDIAIKQMSVTHRSSCVETAAAEWYLHVMGVVLQTPCSDEDHAET